jgi:hypothetical protein
MAALEMGAMPYAKGLLNNQFRNYVRSDGMINYRGEEMAQQARMLTILALYHSYSGGDDAFLLEHFAKAKGIADWLVARRAESLQYPEADPRHGIPHGPDEDAETTPALRNHDIAAPRFYANAAEMYRAFTELGRVWNTIGNSTGRPDIQAHGAQLVALAPQLFKDLHASMSKTVNISAEHRCWPQTVEKDGSAMKFGSYSELMWSGALTARQTGDIYTAAGSANCGPKHLTLGSPGVGGPTVASRGAFGFAFGLLQQDLVEQYLPILTRLS